METTLINLPDIALENIFSYFSYDETARLRLVCRFFDQICKKRLNKGFVAAEKFHLQCLKSVKAQLPRRESERRTHPMARHCDILTAIETRLSMLSMTFIKYIDMNLCCFIPGKVIDEIFRVLRYVKNSKAPPRAHEILQELRDISSMAMEHFDEKIVPLLRHNFYHDHPIPRPAMLTNLGSSILNSVSTCERIATPHRVAQHLSQMSVHQRENRDAIMSMKLNLRKINLKIRKDRSQLKLHDKKLQAQEAIIHDQETTISDLKAQLVEQKKQISDQQACIADMKKHLDELLQKNGSSNVISSTTEDRKFCLKRPVEVDDDCEASTSKKPHVSA